MTTRLLSIGLRSAVGLGLFAAGCSIVNSFDDLKPLTDGTYGPSSQSGGDASTSEGPFTEGGADADAGAAPTSALVVTGLVDTDSGAPPHVLTVLDPATGAEIAPREPMVVTAIRHDGVRDLWFIFESSTTDFAPGSGDKTFLHVRKFDLATRSWSELSKREVPVPQSYDSVVVLTDRVGYVAYRPSDAGGTAVDFVTLDTASPANVGVLATQALTGSTPLGAMGVRSTTGPGGNVGLLRITCAGPPPALCPLEILPVLVPNGGTPAIQAPVTVASISRFATPSYASLADLDRNVVVIPSADPADAAAPTSAVLFEPRNHVAEGTPTTFSFKDSVLRRAAVSECQRVAFVVGGNADLDLHAVPLTGDGQGTTFKISTGHSGQSVFFEPSTSTVLTPFSQGAGFDLSAFRLGGTKAAPTLTPRKKPDWNPPTDLRPILVGVRQTQPIVCP